jgi:hypothetical protein
MRARLSSAFNDFFHAGNDGVSPTTGNADVSRVKKIVEST